MIRRDRDQHGVIPAALRWTADGDHDCQVATDVFAGEGS
jgi:hypothetical protein